MMHDDRECRCTSCSNIDHYSHTKKTVIALILSYSVWGMAYTKLKDNINFVLNICFNDKQRQAPISSNSISCGI